MVLCVCVCVWMGRCKGVLLLVTGGKMPRWGGGTFYYPTLKKWQQNHPNGIGVLFSMYICLTFELTSKKKNEKEKENHGGRGNMPLPLPPPPPPPVCVCLCVCVCVCVCVHAWVRTCLCRSINAHREDMIKNFIKIFIFCLPPPPPCLVHQQSSQGRGWGIRVHALIMWSLFGHMTRVQ